MGLTIPIRDALRSEGKKAAGAWLTIPSTVVARTIANTDGVSWVVIDGEHGLITDEKYYDLANTIADRGVSPFIRIPGDEPWMIKRALDAGAHGIVVPMVNSLDIVRKVVAACKYPPNGVRGFGPMFTHAAGALGAQYRAAADAETLIAVQIEHPDSLRDVEAICKEGIDIAFIGPFDLALSMGVEFGSQEHEDAIARILAAAKSAGKLAAIFCLTGEQSAKRFEQGFDLVSVTTDIDSITAAFANELSAAVKASGVASAKSGYSM
ncbi:Phosphoenolpyruvate/pyruvate domain-containing protein [Punctularia strigosozonata HHB-11173 SS5]|uniref:Phosphoenolpyruvate/pyruvate domain-containing protein n=1 Tax=Punctularia strigosozonata (strain HHB-11173) TaxID=741275 RepID=UPI0004417C09|nr:Phosphoenolpyruvate/pyruvate domain-containing protein [Punctularia strigosozonata HHB-11173 SS5]EIN13352.1 Phosphoenolpyruvate/pyruvate domain-containing protein [Punctularia strigosozonata HHB-11173 SS5]